MPKEPELHKISESIKQGQENRSKLNRHLKQWSLGLISAGLLILDWWLVKISLFGDMPASFWIWPIIVTTLWVVFVSFFALINPDRWTFFTFNSLGLIAYLVLMPRDIYIFIGGALFFMMSLWFQRRIQDEEKNQLNFSIRRTLGTSQLLVTYALLILLGFMLYSNINDDFKRDPEAFYRRLAQTAVKGIPYISQDRSKYNLNQSVEEYFRKQAQEEYPEFNQVSAEEQRQFMNQIRDNFSQQFGVQADENTSLLTAMTEIITQRMREALGKYERFFPLVFTLIIVALFKTFAFVFNWLVLIISWLLYKLLLLVKFFRLEKKTVEVEQLDL